MKHKILSLGLLACVAFSCKKDDNSNPTTDVPFSGNFADMMVPDNFTYNTTDEIGFSVDVKDLSDQPLGGVMVNFYTDDPDFGGEFIGNALTNSSGVASSKLLVPSYLETMFVQAAFPGFANSKTVNVQQGLNASFGGIPQKRSLTKSSGIMDTVPAGDNLYFIGSFNAQGVPNYLEPTGDVLSAQFLSDVNASFPERKPVPINNPQYMATSNELDVTLLATSDVWVTFVSEGAGYKNALMYYVFDTGNPPTDPSQIDSMFVVFPNSSFSGSGGGLQAGDKVRLGTFAGGKTISWAILANGWKNNGTLNTSKPIYYSNSAFNTIESNPNKRQHSVQLVDNARQLLVNGFEDLPRSNNRSDDDYNDLIFYVTANPWSACDISNIPPVTLNNDQDNDGAPDDVDEFPSDPSRAYTCDFEGTLAYEDLWPSLGDNDFNDLVVDYNIKHISNADNKVVELETDWIVRAVGAGFKNGFGFQFENVAPSMVASVTGQDLQEGIITNGANGTESNQALATIIAFDNVFNVIQNPGTAFINTVKGQATADPETLSVGVSFNSPQDLADLGMPPFNSFLIVNQNRAKEVHLADYPPTDLADQSAFGKADDDSKPSEGKYYKTENNLPWALNVAGGLDYPVEYAQITDAYPKFASWAMSGGLQFPDWYLDIPGNRDATKIY